MRLFLSIACSIIFLTNQAQTVSLSYSITCKDTGSLSISLRCKGHVSGITELKVKSDWAGGYDGQTFIKVLKIAGAKSFFPNPEKVDLLTIHHKPGAMLDITYSVKNVAKYNFSEGEDAYLPLINSKYFSCIGHNLFVYPVHDSASKATIQLQWNHFPATWQMLNSFGKNQRTQTITAIPFSDFLSSIFTAGEMRTYRFSIAGKPVDFGIVGKWNFSDTDLISDIKTTVSFQRNFWRDYTQPYFAITLFPFYTPDEYNNSLMGTSLTHSFATWATNNKMTRLSTLRFLYNHELMHQWIGIAIENAQPEEQTYWFSEGFTEYFTYVNMLKSGLMNKAEYISTIDSILVQYYTSPVAQQPNDSITKTNFWSSRFYEKLPYNRGHIFGAYLDEWIKKHSGRKYELRDVMLYLLASFRKEKQLFKTETLQSAIKTVTSLQADSIIQKFILQGMLIGLSDWNALRADWMAYKEVPVYFNGITYSDGSLKKDAIIASVDSASGAAKAGIMPGDVVVGYSIYNDPKMNDELTVQRDGKKLVFRYFPARAEKILQTSKNTGVF